jgi:hypothetical protein
MTVVDELKCMLARARNDLVTAAAHERGQAIQLDHEAGRETMISAQLKFRAALFDLFAAALGHRS